MIQELEDRIERIESAEKKVYDVFIENDPAVAQANKLNAEKVPTKDEFIESMFGTYENAELDQLYATEAVNTATLGILSPVADAYRYRRVNPERLYRSVRQPMWSELSSEEQSEIMDRAKADA